MKLLPVLSFLAVSASALQAQEQAASQPPVLPPGPLIQKRAPEYSRWTITVFSAPGKPPPKAASAMSPSANPAPASPTQASPQTYPTVMASPPANPAPASPALTSTTLASPNSLVSATSLHTIFSSTTVTKTGDLIRVAWADGNNEVWNIWVMGSRQVCVWPDGKRMGTPAAIATPLGSSSSAGNPLFQNFTDSDFHGFEWISPSNFTGFDLINGKKCLIFKSDTGLAATDFETRLPVQLQANGELTLYRFQPVRSTMQSPPDAVQIYFKSLAPTATAPVPTPAPY
jgi:hypothetical protein